MMRWVIGRAGWTLVLGLGLLTIAGGSNGCGDDGLMTKGTYCSRIAGPVCDREIACGLGPSSDRSGCLSAFQQGCCQNGNTCGERASDQTEQMLLEQIITECSAAIKTFDCAQLQAQNAPLECGGSAASPAETTPPAPAAPSIAAVREAGRQAARGLFGSAP